MIGYFVPPDVTEREMPFVWRQSQGLQTLRMPVAAHYGLAEALNNHGLVVGWSYMLDSDSHRPLIWNAQGEPQEAPELDGTLATVNDSGVVAGRRSTRSGVGRGVTWPAGGGTVRFLSQGASEPTDINSRGDICGRGYEGTTSYAAVWLTDATLRITTPNTLSKWGIGTTQRLAWSYSGSAAQFNIDISRGGENDWEVIDTIRNSPGISTNYYWTVTGPAASAARLRVTAVGDPSAVDTNDADIRIAPAAIRVLNPRTRDTEQFGSTQRIFYTHNLGARALVAVDVSGDGGRSWRTVAGRVETNGSTTASFYWTVDLTPTTQGRVRVRALDGSGAVGMSAAFAVSRAAFGSVSE